MFSSCIYIFRSGSSFRFSRKFNSNWKNNNEGKLYFSIGADYRLGIIFNSNKSVIIPYTLGVDEVDLNKGTGFQYTLDYYLINNLSLGFAHSLRYEHLYEGSRFSIPGGEDSTAAVPDIYGLLMDYHFFTKFHFQILNEKLFIQLGISILNIGQNLNRNRDISFEHYGNEYIHSPEIDLKDTAIRFGLGYEKNKCSLFGGVYFSDNNPFYAETNYIVPYVGFKYRLSNLFK